MLTVTNMIDKKHPHVRGEDTGLIAEILDEEETPPRAWGRPKDVFEAAYLPRNTPTCVGKTNPLPPPSSKTQKHPHVRGEDQSRPCS